MKNYFRGIIMTREEKKRLAEKERLLELIENARQDLEDSRRGFNEVCENDLIDYFIYSNYAFERRYLHLLKMYESLNSAPGA